VTVTNTIGEIAYDYYEFFVNDAPVTGAMTFKADGSTDFLNRIVPIDSLNEITLSSWYDQGDDKEQKLKLKVYIYLKKLVGITE
jgi:hypothetical protein